MLKEYKYSSIKKICNEIFEIKEKSKIDILQNEFEEEYHFINNIGVIPRAVDNKKHIENKQTWDTIVKKIHKILYDAVDYFANNKKENIINKVTTENKIIKKYTEEEQTDLFFMEDSKVQKPVADVLNINNKNKIKILNNNHIINNILNISKNSSIKDLLIFNETDAQLHLIEIKNNDINQFNDIISNIKLIITEYINDISYDVEINKLFYFKKIIENLSFIDKLNNINPFLIPLKNQDIKSFCSNFKENLIIFKKNNKDATQLEMIISFILTNNCSKKDIDNNLINKLIDKNNKTTIEINKIRNKLFNEDIISLKNNFSLAVQGVSSGKSTAIPSFYLNRYSNEYDKNGKLIRKKIGLDCDYPNNYNLVMTSIIKKQLSQLTKHKISAREKNIPFILCRSQSDLLPSNKSEIPNVFNVDRDHSFRDTRVKFCKNLINSISYLIKHIDEQGSIYNDICKNLDINKKYFFNLFKATENIFNLYFYQYQTAIYKNKHTNDFVEKQKETIIINLNNIVNNFIIPLLGENSKSLILNGFCQYLKNELHNKEKHNEISIPLSFYYVIEFFSPFEICKYLNCIIILTSDKKQTAISLIEKTSIPNNKNEMHIKYYYNKSYFNYALSGVISNGSLNEINDSSKEKDIQDNIKNNFLSIKTRTFNNKTYCKNYFYKNDIGFLFVEDEEHDSVARSFTHDGENNKYVMDKTIKTIDGSSINYLNCGHKIYTYYNNYYKKNDLKKAYENITENNDYEKNCLLSRYLIGLYFKNNCKRIGFNDDEFEKLCESFGGKEWQIQIEKRHRDLIKNSMRNVYLVDSLSLSENFFKKVKIKITKSSIIVDSIETDNIELEFIEGEIFISLFDLISIFIAMLDSISNLKDHNITDIEDIINGTYDKSNDKLKINYLHYIQNKNDNDSEYLSLYKLIGNVDSFLEPAKKMLDFLSDTKDNNSVSKEDISYNDWIFINCQKKFVFECYINENDSDINQSKDMLRININIVDYSNELKIIQFLQNPNNKYIAMSGTRGINLTTATFYHTKAFETFNRIFNDCKDVVKISLKEPTYDEFNEHLNFINHKNKNKNICIGYANVNKIALKSLKLDKYNNIKLIDEKKNKYNYNIHKKYGTLFNDFKAIFKQNIKENINNKDEKELTTYPEMEFNNTIDGIIYALFHNKNTFIIGNSHRIINAISNFKKEEIDNINNILKENRNSIGSYNVDERYYLELIKKPLEEKDNILIISLKKEDVKTKEISIIHTYKLLCFDKEFDNEFYKKHSLVGNNESVILISSYKSAGTGLNLQLKRIFNCVAYCEVDFDCFYITILPYFNHTFNPKYGYDNILNHQIQNMSYGNLYIRNIDNSDKIELVNYKELDYLKQKEDSNIINLICLMQAIGRIERTIGKQDSIIIFGNKKIMTEAAIMYYDAYIKSKNHTLYNKDIYDFYYSFASVLNRALFLYSIEYINNISMSEDEKHTFNEEIGNKQSDIENNFSEFFDKWKGEYKKGNKDYFFFKELNEIIRGLSFNVNDLSQSIKKLENLSKKIPNKYLRDTIKSFSKNILIKNTSSKALDELFIIRDSNNNFIISDYSGYGYKTPLYDYFNSLPKKIKISACCNENIKYIKKIEGVFDRFSLNKEDNNIKSDIPNPELAQVVLGNIGESIVKLFLNNNNLSDYIVDDNEIQDIYEEYDFILKIEKVKTIIAIDVKNWKYNKHVEDKVNNYNYKNLISQKYERLKNKYKDYIVRVFYINTSTPEEYRNSSFESIFNQNKHINYISFFQERYNKNNMRTYNINKYLKEYLLTGKIL